MSATYRLLAAPEVAERCGISKHTLAKLRARRDFAPAVKIGGSVRWRPEDVDAWIARQIESPALAG